MAKQTRTATRMAGRARHAFSLIELLVVIAIIALLIGILLPTLSAARRKARATTCAAHLRVIGEAFHTYAAENAGMWPVVVWWFRSPATPDQPDGGVGVRSWFDLISPYLGPDLNPDGTKRDDYLSVRGSSPIWGCPDWQDPPPHGGPGYCMSAYPQDRPDQAAVDENGMPAWAAVPFGSTPPIGRFYLQTEWVLPSEKGLVYESHMWRPWGIGTMVPRGWPWWDPRTDPMPQSPGDYPVDYPRHAGGRITENTPSSNVLFVDGHVDLLSPKQAHYALTFYSEAAP
jgi:prepilin-type N-terminal cleavage/methylation domain-containing protein/prepilin-type processing-associated H-X9-DG protein